MELTKIIKVMKFFKETIVPMTDEDAIGIVKRLKYEYAPMGTPIRKALDISNRFCYIVCGKVVCSLPSEAEYLKRAKANNAYQDIDIM